MAWASGYAVSPRLYLSRDWYTAKKIYIFSTRKTRNCFFHNLLSAYKKAPVRKLHEWTPFLHTSRWKYLEKVRREVTLSDGKAVEKYCLVCSTNNSRWLRFLKERRRGFRRKGGRWKALSYPPAHCFLKDMKLPGALPPVRFSLHKHNFSISANPYKAELLSSPFTFLDLNEVLIGNDGTYKNK